MTSYFSKIFEGLGHAVLMCLRTLRFLPTVPRQWQRIVDQCWFMGYSTIPLVVLLSLSIGAVLALQIAFSLRELQVNQYIGSIIGVAMVRELGPVMTAIMVAGRVGSATTAELASMRVYQEVDALKTMNIPPERFLVLPRFVAIALVMPILTTGSIITGWIGGQLVIDLVPWIDLSTQSYYNSLRAFVDGDALVDGLIKAEIFGLLIITVCCHIGLRTSGGPREIGQSVTKAVVVCITLILAVDYFVTDFLLNA